MSGGLRNLVIGDLRVPLVLPRRLDLVPRTLAGLPLPGSALRLTAYRRARLHSQEALAHLHWMLQKDLINQDILLLGRPNAGEFRRDLAMRFCEITEREAEFVALSRDTVESDLKQRREIVSPSNSRFIDQGVVRAAVEGRVLILDGLENTERNVLPLLNNLLENREMHLEDGRFITSAQRYDYLLSSSGLSDAELQRRGLVRASPRFRVIALANPVPPYPGNPLDPPLRSRFQARNVESLPAAQQGVLIGTDVAGQLAKLKQTVEEMSKLGAASSRIDAAGGSRSVDLPDTLPASFCDIVERFPSAASPAAVFERLYPYTLLFDDDKSRLRSIREALQSLPMFKSAPSSSLSLSSLGVIERLDEHTARWSTDDGVFVVPCGSRSVGALPDDFVATPGSLALLRGLLQDHSCGRDACVLQPRGCAKTSTVLAMATLLGYEVETFALYKDITHRELLQRRVTLPDGRTAWQPSPLVDAAVKGRLCVLDNVHQLPPGGLSALQSLVQQRQATLFDGTRLVPRDEYLALNADVRAIGSCRPVHPAFRLVVLGELPKKHANFLTPDLFNAFTVHAAAAELLAPRDVELIVRRLVPALPQRLVAQLVDVAGLLHADANLPDLSLRQLLRIARKLQASPQQQLAQLVCDTLLFHYMPKATQTLLRSRLARYDAPAERATTSSAARQAPLRADSGNSDADEQHLVPRVDYFQIPSQAELVAKLDDDYRLGEHVLLVGQQGVGKNKVVDYFLQQHGLPRQYCQLHRDFTVQALTLQTNIVDGQLVSTPSPLFLAATLGHTLVLDEADKAPTEVVSVLKGLCEGDMRLSDGRRLVSAARRGGYASDDESVLTIHPDFRMIVLANPPGWPFLGNDFYGYLGDYFAVHVVHNPDLESEVRLLASYAPALAATDGGGALLRQLAQAFRLLRERVDAGKLTYPYSTRECIAVVKHLNRYPRDSLHAAIANVFAFDAYDPHVRLQILDCLGQAGLAVAPRQFLDSDALVAEHAARLELRHEFERSLDGKQPTGPKHGQDDPDNAPHVGGNNWAGGTGGRDTAGLGGVGGPYRLDKGHDVHQVPQHEKDAVSEEIRRRARQMADAELKNRLAQIDLDPGQSDVYERYLGAVQPQIAQLRSLLDGLHGRVEERQWLKHQTSGDLDDNRLIEGIAGDKAIYRRRGDASSSAVLASAHTPLLKKKRIKFVVDISGSMYRFNGYDGRLERMIEAAVMIMESFEGFASTIDWAIAGHSGDSEDISLVRWDRPTENRKQRFQVIQRMFAHTQYCMSGDNTIEAIRHAVADVGSVDADEHFVIVLSDANLDRYGIRPAAVLRALTADPKVKASVVFVASLWNEAELLKRELPGKAFVCLQASDLPTTFTHILKQTLA